jgi:hypothetical protein
LRLLSAAPILGPDLWNKRWEPERTTTSAQFESSAAGHEKTHSKSPGNRGVPSSAGLGPEAAAARQQSASRYADETSKRSKSEMAMTVTQYPAVIEKALPRAYTPVTLQKQTSLS